MLLMENGFVDSHRARVGESEISFSSFNQMQSTVPMRSNVLTLTVGMPDLGWVKEAAPLLWRMLREAIVSPLFVGIGEGREWISCELFW